MKAFRYVVLVLIVNCQLAINNYAQDIQMGMWRSHSSFNDIHAVAVTPNNVYAAASSGIMIFDKTERSITTRTTLDGLSSTNITYLAFDQPRSQLIITYADGDVDIVRDNEIINFSTLKNSTTISGSKRINHISIRQNLAYFSTDFGVVVFDLIQLAVKETWRDIGASGTAIRIHQSTFYNDSIFLATQQGGNDFQPECLILKLEPLPNLMRVCMRPSMVWVFMNMPTEFGV
jgi:WD40 repeat protein